MTDRETSTHEQYQTRKLYRHVSSIALRMPAKPAAAAGEIPSIKSRHQVEASTAAEEARTARRHLLNKQKTRSANAPHASYESQERRENDELDMNLKARRKALAERHDRELDAAKQQHMPK